MIAVDSRVIIAGLLSWHQFHQPFDALGARRKACPRIF